MSLTCIVPTFVASCSAANLRLICDPERRNAAGGGTSWGSYGVTIAMQGTRGRKAVNTLCRYILFLASVVANSRIPIVLLQMNMHLDTLQMRMDGNFTCPDCRTIVSPGQALSMAVWSVFGTSLFVPTSTLIWRHITGRGGPMTVRATYPWLARISPTMYDFLGYHTLAYRTVDIGNVLCRW